jgi:gas vesicle protein
MGFAKVSNILDPSYPWCYRWVTRSAPAPASGPGGKVFEKGIIKMGDVEETLLEQVLDEERTQRAEEAAQDAEEAAEHVEEAVEQLEEEVEEHLEDIEEKVEAAAGMAATAAVAAATNPGLCADDVRQIFREEMALLLTVSEPEEKEEEKEPEPEPHEENDEPPEHRSRLYKNMLKH